MFNMYQLGISTVEGKVILTREILVNRYKCFKCNEETPMPSQREIDSTVKALVKDKETSNRIDPIDDFYAEGWSKINKDEKFFYLCPKDTKKAF